MDGVGIVEHSQQKMKLFHTTPPTIEADEYLGILEL